jgi:hypothetical protein
MKLTEKQAFKIINKIEDYFNLKIEPEERADFVMMGLINLELGKWKQKRKDN